MQFHGTADRYTLSGATAVATLYSTAATATPNPAVTLRGVGVERRPGGGVHLRPRALGRLHAPGQPGLGGPGARRQSRRSAPTTCSTARGRRPPAGLGRPEQGRDPAGRRAAAPARQPDHRDEPRPEAAAALLVPAARREGGRRDDRRRPRQRRHRRPLRPATRRSAPPAARSPTGSACAARRTSIPNTPLTDAQARGLRRPTGFEVGAARRHRLRATTRRRRSRRLHGTSWRSSQPSTRASPAPSHEPHALHRLERLGHAAEGRARARHPARHQLLLLAAGLGRRPPGLFTGSGYPDALRRPRRHDDRRLPGDDADDRRVGPDATRARPTRCSTARSAPRATTAPSRANMHTDQADLAGLGRDRRLGAGARRARSSPAQQMLDWLDGRNGSSFDGDLRGATSQLELRDRRRRRGERPAGDAPDPAPGRGR